MSKVIFTLGDPKLQRHGPGHGPGERVEELESGLYDEGSMNTSIGEVSSLLILCSCY